MKRLINRIARLTALMAVVAATAVLASCSKEPAELLPQGGDGVIRLSADVVVAAEDDTRAPVIDGTTAKAVLSDMHFLRKDGETMQTNFGGITALSAARDAEGKITFAGTAPTYDKVNDHNAYLVAYWPTTAANGATVTAGEKVTWKIGGQTDILLSTLTPTASYSAGKYTAPISAVMPLNHAMAQLEVIIKAVPTTTASLAAVQAMWGKITGCVLVNTPSKATYTYATNSIDFSNSQRVYMLNSTTYDGIMSSLVIPANSSTATSAVGMYAPNDNGQLRMQIFSEKFPDPGIEVPVQLKDAQGANCAFAAGKRYVVTLTLGADDKPIGITSTVEAWNEGFAGQGNSGVGAPAVGDFYYTDGTWSTTKNTSKTVEGVVYWINPEDPTHFKLITPDNVIPSEGGANADGEVPWSTGEYDITSFYPGMLATYDDTAGDAVNINAAGRLSGVANRDYLRQWLNNPVANPSGKTIADFPAFKACDDYGKGWFLPAVNELQHFYCAYAGVAPMNWAFYNNDMPGFQTGYPDWWSTRIEPLDPTDYGWWYGCSTLDESTVWYQIFAVSYAVTSNDNYQSGSVRVRCIKEINPMAAKLTPEVEDYYYADGTFSRELRNDKPREGVVFWVDPANSKHFKIVSMDEPPANWEKGGNPEGKLPWSRVEENAGIGLSDDGKGNTLKLMQRANADDYRAAKWCYAKNNLSIPASSSATVSAAGYNWYLPAKDEMQYLLCAYRGITPRSWDHTNDPSLPLTSGYPDAWNARFAGATAFIAVWYQIVGENGRTGNSVTLFLNGITTRGGGKVHNYQVRCIREITLP